MGRIRHVSHDVSFEAGEPSGSLFRSAFSIAGVDIDPAFDYKIANLHFTSANYFGSNSGSRGPIYLSFYYLPSDSAQYFIDNASPAVTQYAFNGVPASSNLELSVSDMVVRGIPSAGNNFNNYLQLENVGSAAPSFFSVPKAYAYHATGFGLFDFLDPFQQSHKEFYLPKTQFQRLYFSIYSDPIANVVSTTYYCNGMVNFDLIQVDPEAA